MNCKKQSPYIILFTIIISYLIVTITWDIHIKNFKTFNIHKAYSYAQQQKICNNNQIIGYINPHKTCTPFNKLPPQNIFYCFTLNITTDTHNNHTYTELFINCFPDQSIEYYTQYHKPLDNLPFLLYITIGALFIIIYIICMIISYIIHKNNIYDYPHLDPLLSEDQIFNYKI